MGIQDRIRNSIMGGGGKSDPPEYGCAACRHRFNSNKSPRKVTCPDCDSDDVELLAHPDLADGSHPLDPSSDDGSSDPDETADAEGDSDETAGDEGDPDDEAAAVRELLTTGRYRCLECREAFDPEGSEPRCPECGSDDVKERFES